MILAAVQVRMGSTRLANKALAEVCGKPILWHIVNRLRFSERVDRVVIATSNEGRDAPIRAFAETNDIPYYAGSQADVLDRLYSTAIHFDADALVRITGDCPLADPGVVDQLVTAYLHRSIDVDFITNTLPPTYPDGLDAEVYPTSTLERLWNEIEEPFWREWFFGYLIEHQDTFRPLNVSYHGDLSRLRWTVDYQEDLDFVRQVYRRLYREGEVFLMADVLALMRAEPELTAINAKYARNEGYQEALRTRPKVQTKEKEANLRAEASR